MVFHRSQVQTPWLPVNCKVLMNTRISLSAEELKKVISRTSSYLFTYLVFYFEQLMLPAWVKISKYSSKMERNNPHLLPPGSHQCLWSRFTQEGAFTYTSSLQSKVGGKNLRIYCAMTRMDAFFGKWGSDPKAYGTDPSTPLVSTKPCWCGAAHASSLDSFLLHDSWR